MCLRKEDGVPKNIQSTIPHYDCIATCAYVSATFVPLKFYRLLELRNRTDLLKGTCCNNISTCRREQVIAIFSCQTLLSTSVFFQTRHWSVCQNDISNPCDPNPLWGRQGGDRPPSQSDRNHCCSRILSTAVGKTYVGDLSCIFGVCTDPYEPKILLLLNILNI